MASLTENIREELRSRKLSLRKVHLATGLQRVTVKAFLEGKEVHSSTLDLLAEFLGMAVSFPAKEPVKKSKTSV